jgi:hypothetical protein
MLAVATCITGVYSGIKDLHDSARTASENDALRSALQTTQDTLNQTRVTLSGQLAQARQETIDAKNATIKATQDSADRLTKTEGAHAAELGKQQELTFAVMRRDCCPHRSHDNLWLVSQIPDCGALLSCS